MTDIVERLRRKQAFERRGYAYDAILGLDPDCVEAAAEIERLRGAERESFQKYVDANEALIEIDAIAVSKKAGSLVRMQRIARKALALSPADSRPAENTGERQS